MTDTILAVDCGGSRTGALLIGPNGQIARSLSAPPANLQTAGASHVAQVIAQLCARAPEADRIALGIAGLRRPDDAGELIEALARAGIAKPVAVYPDVRIALRAGIAGDGIVIVAGTGVAAYGRRGEREARAGGWGSALGDEGGAYWMVASLLRTALRALDEGDPGGAGILTPMLAQAGIDDPEDLRRLAAGESGVARVAALLPAATCLWRERYPLAHSLLVESAGQLARLAGLAARRLELEPGYPVVFAGGMAAAFPELPDMVQDAMGGAATVDVLTADPAWGAYLLAREEGRWIVPDPGSGPATERPNPSTELIDGMSTLELLALINAQDAAVPGAVQACLPTLAGLVDETAARMRRGGRLIYLGAGTSGRLAMLDAVECVPTFGVEPDRVMALIAGGDAALTRSVEGAEDDAAAGARAVDAAGVADADIVVGISASGGARYVLAGMTQAQERGAATALITCNPGASRRECDFNVVIPVGPEVIAGSTRLKAGTAQKLVLNMLSTAAMVRLGRTAGNRMIGVRPANAKLRQRAVLLAAELSGANEEQARRALEATGWDVTCAVLTLRTGDPARARTLLAAANGDLARALQLIE